MTSYVARDLITTLKYCHQKTPRKCQKYRNFQFGQCLPYCISR